MFASGHHLAIVTREAAAVQTAESCRALHGPDCSQWRQKGNKRLGGFCWTAGASSGATPLLRQHNSNLHQGQAGREIAPLQTTCTFLLITHYCGSSGKIRKGIILICSRPRIELHSTESVLLSEEIQ